MWRWRARIADRGSRKAGAEAAATAWAAAPTIGHWPWSGPWPWRIAPSDVSGATFHAGGGHLGQAFGHARLPARPGGAPALDDLGRQTQTDQLTRAGRTRATAPVDHDAGQHRVGEFRKLPVLVGLHCVRVHALEVGAQGTARGGCGHGRWPFAC